MTNRECDILIIILLVSCLLDHFIWRREKVVVLNYLSDLIYLNKVVGMDVLAKETNKQGRNNNEGGWWILNEGKEKDAKMMMVMITRLFSKLTRCVKFQLPALRVVLYKWFVWMERVTQCLDYYISTFTEYYDTWLARRLLTSEGCWQWLQWLCSLETGNAFHSFFDKYACKSEKFIYILKDKGWKKERKKSCELSRNREWEKKSRSLKKGIIIREKSARCGDICIFYTYNVSILFLWKCEYNLCTRFTRILKWKGRTKR